MKRGGEDRVSSMARARVRQRHMTPQDRARAGQDQAMRDKAWHARARLARQGHAIFCLYDRSHARSVGGHASPPGTGTGTGTCTCTGTGTGTGTGMGGGGVAVAGGGGVRVIMGVVLGAGRGSAAGQGGASIEALAYWTEGLQEARATAHDGTG